VGSRLVFADDTTAILEVGKADTDEIAREARQLMARACGDLPWAVDVEARVASRWNDAHPGMLASIQAWNCAVGSTVSRSCSHWG